MKFIEKILMASEDVKSYLVSGVCKDKELADGSLKLATLSTMRFIRV